jgi:hypothetical protein
MVLQPVRALADFDPVLGVRRVDLGLEMPEPSGSGGGLNGWPQSRTREHCGQGTFET